MELLQLRYFCMVAYHESVTKAAAELMVSQPALSKTIHKLEEEIGAQLFERRGKYIRLNRRGEIFYSQVRRSLELLDGGVQSISDMADAPSGEVKVYAQAASNFLVGLYSRFHERYPHVRLMVSNHTQSDKLQIGDYDVIISSAESYVPRAGSRALLSERMVLAVPAEHPLAEREEINLVDAAPYPFVITDVYNYMIDLCNAAGFSPNIVMQCDNSYTFNLMMERGYGISVVPEYTLGKLRPRGMRYLPFHNPSSTRTIVLTWNHNRYLSQGATLFRDMAVRYFDEQKRRNGWVEAHEREHADRNLR